MAIEQLSLFSPSKKKKRGGTPPYPHPQSKAIYIQHLQFCKEMWGEKWEDPKDHNEIRHWIHQNSELDNRGKQRNPLVKGCETCCISIGALSRYFEMSEEDLLALVLTNPGRAIFDGEE